MADMKEAIRRLIYQYVVEGAEKVKATQEAVAASTTKTDKASLSLEKTFGSLERRYVETVRAQQDYLKVQERVNAAVQQNPALQERANAGSAAASQRYGQATAAQRAFAVATSGVSAQLVAMSAGAGPVGTFLAALGPAGFAASVGLGAVSAVFDRLIAGAERIGDKSIELRKFSDVTGLSVQQIKGLTEAGGRLHVGSEEIESSLEKFSVGMNEARKGTGALFDQVRAINPALATELAQTTNQAQAWDVLAKALQGATEASQRNALARAAFGKGGIETGLVAVESATKGGIDAISKGINLTKDWNDETARLRAENVQLEKSIKNAMDSAYALEILQRQNQFLKLQKDITIEFLKMDKVPLALTELAAAAGPLGNLAAGAVQLGNMVTQPRTSGVSADEKRDALLNAGAAATLDPAALESWHQLEDAMGRIVQQSNNVVSSLEKEKQARAYLANTERERLALLGAAVTEQEKLNLKTLELKVALDQGKLSLQDYERAVAGLSQAFNNQMVALQGQLAIAQQLTGIGQINAQYEAAITNAKQQGLILSQEIAKADLQREIALAQVNTQADQQLKSLEQQNELLQASSEWERAQIQARQEYNNLIDKGVDAERAGAIAAQMRANADQADYNKEYEQTKNRKEEEAKARDKAWRSELEAEQKAAEAIEKQIAGIRTAADAWKLYEDRVISWSLANDLAGERTQALAAAAEDASYWAHQLASSIFEAGQAALIANSAFVPFATAWASLGGSGLGTGGAFQGKQGLSQFNPEGYTSTTVNPIMSTWTKTYGEGGFDPATGQPNAQGLLFAFNNRFNQALTSSGGNLQGAVGSIIGQGGVFTGSETDPQRLALLDRAINLMPKEQQIGAYQGLMGQLQAAPQTLQTAELTKQLGDKLTELTRATDENTSATSAMTDVLSPFYSSDPRRTHLGFRAFAGGGIMTEYGALPLRQYQGGGMATSPQVAVFGEGSTPEAYVPVPSGRIPVEIKGAANSNQRPVNVTINVMGNADAGTVAALKQTSFQKAQALRRITG